MFDDRHDHAWGYGLESHASLAKARPMRIVSLVNLLKLDKPKRLSLPGKLAAVGAGSLGLTFAMSSIDCGGAVNGHREWLPATPNSNC